MATSRPTDPLGPACGTCGFFDIHTGQMKVDLGLEYEESLSQALAPFGLLIDTASIGAMFLDEQRQKLLNTRIEAQQQAVTDKCQKTTVENNAAAQKAKAKVDADAEIEKVQGEAEAARLKAAQQANAITIKAEAEAKAIKKIQAALAANPAYLQYFMIECWNGKIPGIVVGDENGGMSSRASCRASRRTMDPVYFWSLYSIVGGLTLVVLYTLTCPYLTGAPERPPEATPAI